MLPFDLIEPRMLPFDLIEPRTLPFDLIEPRTLPFDLIEPRTLPFRFSGQTLQSAHPNSAKRTVPAQKHIFYASRIYYSHLLLLLTPSRVLHFLFILSKINNPVQQEEEFLQCVAKLDPESGIKYGGKKSKKKVCPLQMTAARRRSTKLLQQPQPQPKPKLKLKPQGKLLKLKKLQLMIGLVHFLVGWRRLA